MPRGGRGGGRSGSRGRSGIGSRGRSSFGSRGFGSRSRIGGRARFSSFGRSGIKRSGFGHSRFGISSRKRSALFNRRRHRSRSSGTVYIEPPQPVLYNSEYHRFFEYDDDTSAWNVSSYDPNIIQNAVTLEEVNTFLAKIVAVPVPEEPCCLSCCPGDYYQKVDILHQQLEQVLQQENEMVRSRGVHWEWSGGSPESMTPYLVLDFNVNKDPNRYAAYTAIKA